MTPGPDASIQRVFSRLEPTRLLHVHANAIDIASGRVDLSATEEALQVSIIHLGEGLWTKPHQHNSRDPSWPVAQKTQESWIVMKGVIKARLFDLDWTLLVEEILGPGSVLVTFRGGHSLENLDPETVIIECKNGPYLGRDYTGRPEPG